MNHTIRDAADSYSVLIKAPAPATPQTTGPQRLPHDQHLCS